MMLFDTIVGISTALGYSATNVVRVSGSEAFAIVKRIFRGPDLEQCLGNTIHYGHIIHKTTVIDEVLVSVFVAPKSFTAEHVVEISTHGGFYVAGKVVELLIENGARLAEPGEFSRRAYLNGRIDLTQAEAIMDVVNAKNAMQLKLANAAMSGEIRTLIESLQTKLLDIIAKIEVNIDYPEYDDAITMTREIIIPATESLLLEIETILQKAASGKIIRDGIKTVIVGKPNVGKSSLLNTLLKEEKAIVTEISGTTRDIVEGEINLGGVILKLADTAGIRETSDAVEKIGIAKARHAMEDADLVLLVLDQSQTLTDQDKTLLELTKTKKRIILGNKIDLGSQVSLPGETMLNISAKKNVGIEALENRIRQLFLDETFFRDNSAVVANARHIGKLAEAKAALTDALNAAYLGHPVDMSEIDLRRAWECLGEITGDVATDALINTLFSKFCLGK